MADDSSIIFRVEADDQAAQKKLADLRKDIEKTGKAIEKTNTQRNGIVEALKTAQDEAKKTADEIRTIQTQMAENTQVLSGQAGNINLEEFNARKQAQAEMAAELTAQQKIYDGKAKAVDKLIAKEQQVTATLTQQTAKMSQLKREAGGVEKAIAEQARSAMPNLRASADQASAAINRGYKSILKWGFGIRSTFILLRRLKSYVKEAVMAFAEQDAETRNNVNALKASLQSLKLSWGAAFAPILNAVVPILQKLISWLTAAANAIAAFFAAIGGKTTYKRAVAGNNALADSYGGAGAAAEKASKQLMGFDEINKLNAENSGGGGGGGAGGGGMEMEEVPVSDKILKLAQLLRDHFKEIAILAGIIGAAIAAWKIAKFIGDFQGLIGIFNKVLGIIMIIGGAVLLVKSYFDAWENGVNWDNLTGMLIGLTLVVGGLALVFGTTVAAVGLLVGSFALLVLAIADWVKTGELGTQTAVLLGASLLGIGIAIGILTGNMGLGLLIAGIGMLIAAIIDWVKTGELGDEAFYLMEVAIGVVGVALSLLTGGPIPLLIAAVAALALAIYKHWDEIKKWTGDLVTKIKSKFDEVKTKFNSIVDTIKSKAKAAVDFLKSIFHFEWHLPDLKLPHIVVGSYIDVPVLGRIPDPTTLRVDWYKRGGIFDSPSLIGVGENGKEAVMPLENNTGWIRELADQLVSAMGNKYSGALSGLPAMAMGGVVPPRAFNSGGFGITNEDVANLAAAIAGALGGDNRPIEINNKLYLDGKQIASSVTRYQRNSERASGR